MHINRQNVPLIECTRVHYELVGLTSFIKPIKQIVLFAKSYNGNHVKKQPCLKVDLFNFLKSITQRGSDDRNLPLSFMKATFCFTIQIFDLTRHGPDNL